MSLEVNILELTTELRSLREFLTRHTLTLLNEKEGKTKPPKSSETENTENAGKAAKGAAKNTKPAIPSPEEVKEAAVAYSNTYGREAALALLATFDAKTSKDLAEEHRAAFIEACKNPPAAAGDDI